VELEEKKDDDEYSFHEDETIKSDKKESDDDYEF